MTDRACLALDIKGLEISERYWREVGLPAFKAAFPQLIDRIAFGLVGEGSECWGFDDRISMDHDYGPSFCVWVTKGDFITFGNVLQNVYSSLPAEFMGRPARHSREIAGQRVGVFDIDTFYARFLGLPEGPQNNMQWLRTPDNYLSVATNGKVFADPLGKFSAVRNKLLEFYPEDVRKKKLAKALVNMAHSGQANYPRVMRRGNIVAAGEAVSKFIEGAISVIYLLNKKYAPYYKWCFRGVQDLAVLSSLSAPLEELAGMGSTFEYWDDKITLDLEAINYNDPRVKLMEGIAETIREELKRQGLSDNPSNYLQGAAFDIYGSITDPELKKLHILA